MLNKLGMPTNGTKSDQFLINVPYKTVRIDIILKKEKEFQGKDK